MDAQKMLGLLKKLCDEKIVDCQKCPVRHLSENSINCWVAVLDNPEKLEAVLLAYEKEKRGKTYLDLLRETFPNAVLDKGMCFKKAMGMTGFHCQTNCFTCWDVPIKEPVE